MRDVFVNLTIDAYTQSYALWGFIFILFSADQYWCFYIYVYMDEQNLFPLNIPFHSRICHIKS